MNKVMNLDDVLNFGKHNGKTVEEVLKIDPQYLDWADDKDIIHLNDGLKETVSIHLDVEYAEYLHDSGESEQFTNF
jgi:hypothetical protein